MKLSRWVTAPSPQRRTSTLRWRLNPPASHKPQACLERFMRSRLFVLIAAAFALTGFAIPASAEPKAPPALTGKVSSAEEGAMKGVVVSAKKGIVTVSVVSDDKGAFSFPASKLDAGDYALSIRAAGYDLQGPQSITLAAHNPSDTTINL